MNFPQSMRFFTCLKILALAIMANWLAGCNLVVGDYRTETAKDASDQDTDGDGGIPDSPGDSDIRACTPIAATNDFSILAGPDIGCDYEHCQTWENLCFADGTRYFLSYNKGQTTHLFDSCRVAFPKTSASVLTCREADGETAIIDERRAIEIRPTILTNDNPHFEYSWTLYHRSMDDLVFLPAKTGCGLHDCEMFDGFQLDPEHYYFIEMTTEDQHERWYQGCSLVGGLSGIMDELDCIGEDGRLVNIRANQLDYASIGFDGVWTVYSEPLTGGMIQIVKQAASGCGTTKCEMMSGFTLDDGFRYALRQSSPELVYWFDYCSHILTDQDTEYMTCRNSDLHYVRISPDGPESSDLPLDADSSWTLVRWALDANNH